LRSFLFTLKNPHNIQARRFALKAVSLWGHSFVVPTTLRGLVWACRCAIAATPTSRVSLPLVTLTPMTPAWTVFMDSLDFRVKEIEVFEISE
jgi:hypothetical protein